jgi:hypothetical protein
MTEKWSRTFASDRLNWCQQEWCWAGSQYVRGPSFPLRSHTPCSMLFPVLPWADRPHPCGADSKLCAFPFRWDCWPVFSSAIGQFKPEISRPMHSCLFSSINTNRRYTSNWRHSRRTINPAARCNPILPFNSKRSRLPNPAVRGLLCSSAFHCFHCSRNVTMPGQEDDRWSISIC